MTDETPRQQESASVNAPDFSAKVYQLDETLDTIAIGILTPRQCGLLADCSGMMKEAAAKGGFADSRRIRDQLIETLSLFAPPSVTVADLPTQQANAASLICRVIDEIAELGNSLETGIRRAGHLGKLTSPKNQRS